MANELLKRGVNVSPFGVRRIWLRHDLATMKLRLKASRPKWPVALRSHAAGALNSVGLHKLKGSLREYWSINVNGRWRILFKFPDGHAYEVHITDPH